MRSSQTAASTVEEPRWSQGQRRRFWCAAVTSAAASRAPRLLLPDTGGHDTDARSGTRASTNSGLAPRPARVSQIARGRAHDIEPNAIVRVHGEPVDMDAGRVAEAAVHNVAALMIAFVALRPLARAFGDECPAWGAVSWWHGSQNGG